MAVASKKIPAPDLVAVRRALLSVSDKTGLAEFAAALSSAGVELVSTGGTAKAIEQAGIAVRDVSELTGFPEIMDGRVKTLHPSVHGALLGVRDDPDHAEAMQRHGIEPIDLVVVNLYPFEEVRQSGADYASIVENIDIGGPAMVRASAKNHAYVAIVTDPQDYASVLNALEMNFGSLSLEFRQKLAAKAFARTAAYDAAISGWFAQTLEVEHPTWRAFGGRLDSVMRYGENPHQQAGFYVTGEKRPGVATARQLQGKQLSYNNINDTDAAFELVGEFDPERSAAVAIIKHANPCGVAEGATLKEAYLKALACDPVSAFGGIVAVNRPLDAESAEEIVKTFTEVIIAPEASEEAQAIIAAKKNLRLLVTGGLPDPRAAGIGVKSVAGGLLVQGRDNLVVDDLDLKVVTKRSPSAKEMADLQIRVPRRQARQVQRHHLCERPGDSRHRRRPDEPRGFLAHRGAQGDRCGRGCRPCRAADQGFGRRVRRLLPVRGRTAFGSGGGRDGGDPAGRFDARRRGDRRRRCARHRHGVHRDQTLPALACLPAALLEQPSFPLDRLDDVAGDRLDAAQRPHALVIDQPVGAADGFCRVHRHEFGQRTRDEGVQDADACAGSHGLHLAERRRDRESGIPVRAELLRVGKRRADDEIGDIADETVRPQFGCASPAGRWLRRRPLRRKDRGNSRPASARPAGPPSGVRW